MCVFENIFPLSQAKHVCLFDLILYIPVNKFSVMSGQVLSKDKNVLLKDTAQWGWWGSNPQPVGLETLPLIEPLHSHLLTDG